MRPIQAPRSAKARTVARPTPAEAPVTTTSGGFDLFLIRPPVMNTDCERDARGSPGTQIAAWRSMRCGRSGGERVAAVLLAIFLAAVGARAEIPTSNVIYR